MLDKITPWLPLLIVAGYFTFLIMCFLKSISWIDVKTSMTTETPVDEHG